MPAKISRSPYYTTPRLMAATARGAFAVSTPTAPPTTGERVAPGKVVGTSTGQLAVLPGQPKGVYFLEVRRPSGAKAWVLSSTVGFSASKATAAQTTAQKLAKVVQGANKAVNVARQVAKQVAPKKAAKASAPKKTAKPAPAAAPIKTGDGQAALQTIVSNDKKTHAWLVKALFWQAKAARNGKGNDALAGQLQGVINSYNARQQKIKGSKLVKVSTGINQTVQGWIEKAKALMGINGPAIGALPIVIPIAVASALAAGAAVWLFLRNEVSPSVKNLQEAAHLSDIYRNMSPEEQDFFDEETKKAAEAGQKAGEESADNSLFGKLKNNILLIGGGILLVNALSGRKRK